MHVWDLLEEAERCLSRAGDYEDAMQARRNAERAYRAYLREAREADPDFVEPDHDHPSEADNGVLVALWNLEELIDRALWREATPGQGGTVTLTEQSRSTLGVARLKLLDLMAFARPILGPGGGR